MRAVVMSLTDRFAAPNDVFLHQNKTECRSTMGTYLNEVFGLIHT